MTTFKKIIKCWILGFQKVKIIQGANGHSNISNEFYFLQIFLQVSCCVSMWLFKTNRNNRFLQKCFRMFYAAQYWLHKFEFCVGWYFILLSVSRDKWERNAVLYNVIEIK